MPTQTETQVSPAPVETVQTGPKPIEAFTHAYTDYRKSDIAANKKFAAVCRVALTFPSITRNHIMLVLEQNGLSEDSQKVECTRILNFRNPENLIVLEQMERGELTINQARMLSTAKAAAERVAKRKEAAGETPTQTEQKSKGGRPEATPSDKIKNFLSAVAGLALDNSVSRDDVNKFLDDAWTAVSEKRIADAKTAADKAAAQAAAPTTETPAAQAAVVEAAQTTPQVVEAVQATPTPKATKGKK